MGKGILWDWFWTSSLRNHNFAKQVLSELSNAVYFFRSMTQSRGQGWVNNNIKVKVKAFDLEKIIWLGWLWSLDWICGLGLSDYSEHGIHSNIKRNIYMEHKLQTQGKKLQETCTPFYSLMCLVFITNTFWSFYFGGGHYIQAWM